MISRVASGGSAKLNGHVTEISWYRSVSVAPLSVCSQGAIVSAYRRLLTPLRPNLRYVRVSAVMDTVMDRRRRVANDSCDRDQRVRLGYS